MITSTALFAQDKQILSYLKIQTVSLTTLSIDQQSTCIFSLQGRQVYFCTCPYTTIKDFAENQ